MKIIIRTRGILLAIVLVTGFSTVSLRAENLLVDPGFEQQTPVDQGGWFPFNGAWFSPYYAHSGNWAMFALSYESFVAPGAFEQFPAAPGSQWRMTGYGMTPNPLWGELAFGIVQVSFFDVFGNDLGTVETSGGPVKAKVSNPVDWTTPAGEWQFLDTGIATAPEGTAYIQAFVIYVDWSGYWNQGVYFDDVNLDVVGMNHGQYVSSIARNAGALRRAGLISEAQSSAMVKAAAKSAGGKAAVDNLPFWTGTYDIHAVDLESGQVRQITHIPDADEYNPSWSNDGKYVVHDVVTLYWYQSLYVTDVRTGVSAPLPGGEYGNDAAWSPNGQMIAFDQLPIGDFSIYTLPPAGGTPELIRNDAVDASWSPDSKYLVFQQPSDGSIRTASLAGGPAAFLGYGQTPTWSPNGQFVVYTDWSGDLWKIGVNHQGVPVGNPIHLTNHPDWENQASWSSDSGTIMFHSSLGGPDFDIWAIPAEGGTPQRVAGIVGAGDYDPCVSTNSKYVAYAGVGQ